MSYLYKIDGTNVNDREDWKHQPVYPGLTDRRAETFPGDPQVYLSIGEALAVGVVITGFIEADTLAGLDAAMRAEYARTAEATLSDLYINGIEDFTDQHLVSFEATGPNVPFRDGGPLKQMRPVRYVWQGVKP